jgi:hypothetical protein
MHARIQIYREEKEQAACQEQRSPIRSEREELLIVPGKCPILPLG